MEETIIVKPRRKFRKSIAIIVFYLLLGFSSYMIFSYYLQYKRILTPLRNDEVTYEVSLSDGTLYFNNYTWYIEDLPTFDEEETYTKSYSKNEYIDYLEKNPLPLDLAKDLVDKTEEAQSLYYNLDNLLIYDNFKFYYSNNENTKNLSIIISKGDAPYYSPLSDNENLRESTMRKTNITLSYYKDSNWQVHYMAEFKYENIGYTIYSQNITQEEFIQILYSIIT